MGAGRTRVRKLALLLRAVNVGGRQLAMADFRKLLEAEGFGAVETLLASGNAVVATEDDAEAVERRVAAALAQKLKLPTEVFARDLAELQAVIAGNPFAEFAEAQPSRMVVVFLKADPPEDLSPLTRWATQGEAVAPGPRCLYITYPQGQGRSKLAQARGGPTGTARNWNTVTKLAERLA